MGEVANLAALVKASALVDDVRHAGGIESRRKSRNHLRVAYKHGDVAKREAWLRGEQFADALRGRLRLFGFALGRVEQFHRNRPRGFELARRDEAVRHDARLGHDDVLHRAQDFPAAPEIFAQLDVPSRRFVNLAAVAREALRLGVAKAENGLVDIADRVEAIGRADERQELRLLSVGVLKLIHQDVVELRAQAGARLRMGLEQPDRVLFEVREIEHAGQPLALAVESVEAAEDIEQQPARGGVVLRDERILRGDEQVVAELPGHLGCRRSLLALGQLQRERGDAAESLRGRRLQDALRGLDRRFEVFALVEPP